MRTLFVFCVVASALGCAPDGLGEANPNFLVIAHRGAPKVTAENTIRSFDVAVALGGNSIETDVCITKDGHFVLWHDRDPDEVVAGIRQLGQEGLAYSPRVPPIGSPFRRPVEQLTLAELRANYGYNDLEGRQDPTAPIALFEEMLDWAAGESTMKAIYIDIKLAPSQESAARTLVESLGERIAAEAVLAEKQYFLLTIHPSLATELERARRETDGSAMRTVIDYEKPGALAATVGAGLRDVSTGITPLVTWSAFRSEVADIVAARERGEIDSVTVWTFDDPERLAELLYYSVDGVMTNEVALLHRMWQQTVE